MKPASTWSDTASEAPCWLRLLLTCRKKAIGARFPATFFVSLIDFSIPGDLGVFIDEQQLENLEKTMNERGYHDGKEMAATFNMLARQ